MMALCPSGCVWLGLHMYVLCVNMCSTYFAKINMASSCRPTVYKQRYTDLLPRHLSPSHWAVVFCFRASGNCRVKYAFGNPCEGDCCLCILNLFVYFLTAFYLLPYSSRGQCVDFRCCSILLPCFAILKVRAPAWQSGQSSTSVLRWYLFTLLFCIISTIETPQLLSLSNVLLYRFW